MSPAAVDPNGTAAASGPLTVEAIPAVRANSAPIPKGVAPATNSDFFKSAHCFTKPKAKRFDHVLSLESKGRKESTLKGAAKYLKNPGLISLGGGLPSPEYFPFEELSIKVPTPPGFSPEETRKTGAVLRAGKSDIRDGKSLYDLEVALNYGQATGSPQLLRFVTEHTELIHNPPYADWQCCLSCGSTYSWDTALRMLCERGDYIMMEEYTFSSAQETATPQGVKVQPIKMDEQGLLPESLDEILSNWDEAARGARKPFVLYTIPTGQNPTGATQQVERRKAVYKVAQKHDVIIVEDEPYYFLQMQPYTGADAEPVPPPANHDEFIKSLIPSYLSLDVDGRVLRLESFSKVLSPGSRVGWVVGSQQLVERFNRNCETSSQNPSGISQLVFYKLLEEQWGHAGYLDWLINLRMQYTGRRDTLVHACENYLPQEIASWNPPAAGMFHWMKIDWQKHPGLSAGKTRQAIEEDIFQAAIDNGVLVSRGSWFKADGISEGDMFFRATFAAASADNISEAIARFGTALRAHLVIQSRQVSPGIQVHIFTTDAGATSPPEISPELWNSVTVLFTWKTLPTKALAPNLQSFQLLSAGCDHLFGVPLFEETDVAFVLRMGCILHEHLENQKIGRWLGPLSDEYTEDPVGLRAGILSYGCIGRQCGRVAKAFGMDVYAYTLHERATPEFQKDESFIESGLGDPEGEFPTKWFHGAEQLSEFLASGLDLLIITLPLTEKTKGVISKEQLALLGRKKAFVSNVARGAIVNMDDLVTALDEGQIRGAALDVTDPEPLPADHKLCGYKNVFLTPHCSGNSDHYNERACKILRHNLGRRFKGEEVVNRVSKGLGY